MKKLVIIFSFVVGLFSPVVSQDEKDFNYEYALIEAVRQKTIGNVNEAIKLYKHCLEVRPDSDVAAYELGSIYAALNQPEIAKQLLEKAYMLKSDNYWYLFAYTQILNFTKDYEQLIDVLESYLKINDDFRMYVSLSDALYNSGKKKKALKILDKLGDSYGISEQIILKKVEILKSEKKFETAQKELSKLIREIPESPEYNIIMAEFLEETGQMEEATKFYLEAYSLDSTNIYAISNLADYYTSKGDMKEGLYFLDRAYSLDEVTLEKKLSTLIYFLGEENNIKLYKAEFERILNTLLVKYPDNYDIRTIAYDFYTKVENYEKSYDIILGLVKEKPDNYIFWQQAVYTASTLEKYDVIISLGYEALKIFPNKKDLNLFIGIAYFQKENYDSCYVVLSSSYEEGMEMNVQIQYLTFLAESAYKIRKVQESFYFFEELLLLTPDNYMVMNNYSYYMALENITLKRAEDLSKKTIEKNPGNATYLDTYAWILFKSGQYERALDYMNKIVNESTNDPDILFHYAWILCKNEEKARARVYFEKAKDAGYLIVNEISIGMDCCK